MTLEMDLKIAQDFSWSGEKSLEKLNYLTPFINVILRQQLPVKNYPISLRSFQIMT